MLPIVIGLSVIACLIGLYLWLRRFRKDCIMIAGVTESGKTALFTMLVHKKHVMTFTSLGPNSDTYKLRTRASRNLTLIDIPSHEKIRYEYVAKNKSRTAGVIFVIDSVSIQKSLKDVAEYLYNLLADATLAKGRVPFLIVCNKQDLPSAKDIIAVEKLLEDEINTLCITKAGALAGLDSGKESVPLVKSGEKFSFAENKHHRVTFAGCSAIEENIGPVRSWLERQ